MTADWGKLARLALDHARNYDTNSIDSSINSCPAQLNEIYIVPTRYALSDIKAEYSSFQPPKQSECKKQAVRRLRNGYLYLWQSSIGLKQFIVAKDGTLVETAFNDAKVELETASFCGIKVKKDEPVRLLYIEGVPLTKEVHNKLVANAEYRNTKMQEFNLQPLIIKEEVTHCVPITENEKVMAELMPEIQAKFLAYQVYLDKTLIDPKVPATYAKTQIRPGMELSEDGIVTISSPREYMARIELYNKMVEYQEKLRNAVSKYPDQTEPPGIWSDVRWDSEAVNLWLNKTKKEACLEEIFIIILSDNIGISRDIECLQRHQEEIHEKWLADNSIKTTIAGFIRSLISEDPSELSSGLEYRYKPEQLQLTETQTQELVRLNNQIDKRYQSFLSEYRREVNKFYSTFKSFLVIKAPNPIKGPEKARVLSKSYTDTWIKTDPQTPTYPSWVPHQMIGSKLHILNIQKEYNVDVQAIISTTRQSIFSKLSDQQFLEAWDYIIGYSWQKQQNITNARAGAQVAERTRLNEVNDWLDNKLPAYNKQRELELDIINKDRNTFNPELYSCLEWRVDFKREYHAEYLDEVGVETLLSQCSTEKGIQQVVETLTSSEGEEIYSLLITRAIPIIEKNITYGSRGLEVLAALSKDNIIQTTEALKVIANTVNGAIFNDEVIAALNRAENAVKGNWGRLVFSLAAAFTKLTYVVVDTLTIPLQRNLMPLLVITRFSDAVSFAKDTATDAWKFIGPKATQLEQQLAKIGEIIKNTTTQYVGLRAEGIRQQANKLEPIGGILPVTMFLINLVNAYNYYKQSQSNSKPNIQQEAEKLSAYFYSASAGATLIQARFSNYVNSLKETNRQLSKQQLVPRMTGVTLCFIGVVVSAFSVGGAYNDATSIGEQITKLGNSSDPMLNLRYRAAQAQTVLFATQTALYIIAGGMALFGYTTAALGILALCMGPLNFLILAAGIIYLIGWANEDTPMQSFLKYCYWGKEPRYGQNPTLEQQVDDLTDLINMMFEINVKAHMKLDEGLTTDVRGGTLLALLPSSYHLAGFTVRLQGANENSKIGVIIKGKFKDTNQVVDLTEYCISRFISRRIPPNEGQGLDLTAPFNDFSLRSLTSSNPPYLEIVELGLSQANPIVATYNEILKEIINKKIQPFYYRISCGFLDGDVDKLGSYYDCKYIKEGEEFAIINENTLITDRVVMTPL